MRLGIDLGGTKIEIVALGASGEELYRARCDSPRGDYAATLEAVARLVSAAERETGQRGSLGVAMPGAISPASGLIKNANSTWLIGKPLDKDLEARLERPVRLQNDANCFAVSEAQDGAAAGLNLVFGAILGTGVGGGIAIAGQPVAGRHAIAGEWGHNPLPWPNETEQPGPQCYCGKYGCIETFLSGPGLAEDHTRHVGESLTAAEIASAATVAGEPAAQASVERYAERLARALASVVNLLDPDAIVLGGGLSAITLLYERVPQLLPRYVFSDHCDTPILPPRHGASSGVRGAAWLWP